MLSRSAQYAIRATLLMAAEPEVYHGASEIASRTGAPPNYMGKMLKILADSGVLSSTRGAGGGFKLARPASEISIFDVVEPIDKVSRWTKCFLGLDECRPEHPCPIHPIWFPIRDRYFSMLQTSSIADLPQGGGELNEYRAAFLAGTQFDATDG